MNEDKVIEFECPGCGEKLSVPLEKARPGTKVPCPGCSSIITLTGDDIPAEIDAALDDMLRRFGKLFPK